MIANKLLELEIIQLRANELSLLNRNSYLKTINLNK